MYKIYKVVSKADANTVYIGSTKRSLQSRLSAHKSDAKYYQAQNKRQKWMLENYEKLDIIEINKADSKNETLSKEREEVLRHIEQGYNVVNVHLANLNISTPPNNKQVTYQAQYRKCNRLLCHSCKNGQRHGPYWYA